MNMVSKYFLFSLSLFQFFISSAQDREIDSLKNLLKSNLPDTSRIASLHELVTLYKRINIDTAFLINKEALLLSEKIDWQKGIAHSHYKMAWLHEGKGDYHLALGDYDKALRLWEGLEAGTLSKEEKIELNGLKARALTNTGNAHAMQGNYPKSLKFSFDALKLANELNDKYLQSNNLASIGSVFSKQREYDKALEYYFRAMKAYQEMGMENGVAYCYIGIGNIYNDKNQYDKALEYYFKSLKINEATGNKSYIAANLGNIGSAYLRQQKNDEALDYFDRALKIDEEQGNTIGKAFRLSSIGTVFARQKKYDAAEAFLLKSLALADTIGSLNIMQDNHRELSELYRSKQDYKKSLEHFQKFSSIKDSIFNEEKERELARYELNYEFEKKEAALKAEQDKKEAVALTEKKRQKIFLLLISFVAIAVALIAIVIFRSLRLTKRQKQIIEEQKEIVEKKQKEVMDSIQYAKRIQVSLLPRDSYIDKNLRRLNNN